MRLKHTLIVPIAALLASCATSKPVSSLDYGILVAQKNEVANCILMTDLHGISGLYGVFAEEGMRKARRSVLQQAKNIEATHIVWTGFEVVYGSTTAHANAYFCGVKKDRPTPPENHYNA